MGRGELREWKDAIPSLTQEEAWKLNYVTAFVELSQDECPLDRPDRIYGAVARSIQAKPMTPSDVDRGRASTLPLKLLDRKFQGVLTGHLNADLRDQAIAWVETSLAATPVESSGFRTAVVQYLLAKLKDDSQKAQVAAVYLRGEPYAAKEFKEIDLYEKLDKASGFRFLRSLCQLIQRSELAAGTILLFDEARRSLSLMSNKAEDRVRKPADSDQPLQQRGASWDAVLVRRHASILHRVCHGVSGSATAMWPRHEDRPGVVARAEGVDLLQMICQKITDVFRTAFEDAPDDDAVLQANLRCVAEQALRRIMVGIGTRRLLVRLMGRALEQFRETGLGISAEEAQKIMRRSKGAIGGFGCQVCGAEGE